MIDHHTSISSADGLNEVPMQLYVPDVPNDFYTKASETICVSRAGKNLAAHIEVPQSLMRVRAEYTKRVQ